MAPSTSVAALPAPATSRPAVTAPRNPACPTIDAALAADTDGDGCPEALRWNDGVLEAGGRRWEVGRPGDRVAAADWSCSGRATLALLRPATGEVFVFDGWAQEGRDMMGELAGRVEGGFAIRAAEVDDGCAHVAVDRADAPAVTLPGVPRR
jgi:hypothetical protein